ncbi:MAG TPA: HDOD domain-containing protein, partial [Lysobacter sp.]
FRDCALGPVPPGADALQDAHREVQAGVQATLANLDAQPERIPRRPQLLPALMRAIGSGNASASAIAALVQQDPTLTGNVLRVANSAYYRVAGRPLESVERAIARLGTDGMRPIIAATLLQPVMHGQRGAFAQFAPIAWEHSLVAATAAAECARDDDRELAQTAHMVALLHGLGGIVVVQAVRDAYARRPLLVPDPRVPAALLDAAGQTAARIAASWELPAPLLEALAAPSIPGMTAGPLAHALACGGTVADAVVLARTGALEPEVAIASLGPVSGRAQAVARRLLEPDGGAAA